MTMRRVSGVLVAVALFTGCKSEEPAKASAAEQAQAVADLLATRPAPSHAPHAAAGKTALHGKVLETLPAGAYTYLRLQTSSGEAWAAIPMTEVAVGTDVAVSEPAMMFDFPSKTLNRTFAKIAFGSGLEGHAAAPVAAAPVKAAAPVVAPTERIEKAKSADGKSIVELFTSGKSVEGKKVAVRAKVVKFSPAIMGKNWLHLRDGSGSAAEKTDDVTVTTQETVKIGDVVTVRGTVALNKDIGAGYVYPVLIEDAAIER